jgi:hypothetical protein
MVVVVGVVLADSVSLRADEAPLARKRLLGASMPLVGCVGRRQRHTLCVGVRVSYGFGKRRGRYPTLMLSNTAHWMIGTSFNITRAHSTRWRTSVGTSFVVGLGAAGPLWERHCSCSGSRQEKTAVSSGKRFLSSELLVYRERYPCQQETSFDPLRSRHTLPV